MPLAQHTVVTHIHSLKSPVKKYRDNILAILMYMGRYALFARGTYDASSAPTWLSQGARVLRGDSQQSSAAALSSQFWNSDSILKNRMPYIRYTFFSISQL